MQKPLGGVEVKGIFQMGGIFQLQRESIICPLGSGASRERSSPGGRAETHKCTHCYVFISGV